MPAGGYNIKDRDCQAHDECAQPAICHGGDCIEFVCSISEDCMTPLICSSGHCQPIVCTSVDDCPTGWVCDDLGACVDPCRDKQCGDDGYGNACGLCATGQVCNAGVCEGCVPSCADKECGEDGCGGNCGPCPDEKPTCTDEGLCVGSCVPDCTSKVCGDDGCEGSCGTCAEHESCEDGVCETQCVPYCVLNACGDDGCGSPCGTCDVGENCLNKLCYSACINAGSCVFVGSGDVGVQGGQISSTGGGAGPASLSIPSGALEQETSLSITVIEGCQEAANVAYTPSSNYVLAKTCTVNTDAPVFVRFKEYISGTQPAPNYNAHAIARNNAQSIGAALALPENILSGPSRGYSDGGPLVDAANCNLSPCDGCASQWPHCNCPQPYEILISDIEAGDVLELWVTAADADGNIPVGNAQAVDVRDFEVESVFPILPSEKTAQGVAYAFEPHGQTFVYPVSISIPYGVEAQSLSVFRLDDVNDDAWEEISEVSFINGQAAFKTTAFSIFVVGHFADCAGTVDGDAVLDTCSVCAGDGSSCPGCIDENACNYDATKTIDDGSCVTCSSDQTCIDSLCCIPDCTDKTCGDDGCGGSCGDCAAEENCENNVCVTNQPVVLCQEAANVAYTPSSNYILAQTCTVSSDTPVFVRFKEYISGTQPAPNYNAHAIARNNNQSIGAALAPPQHILSGPSRGYGGGGPLVDANNCNLIPCDGCASQWPHCHCPQPYEILIRDIEADDVLELWLTASDASGNMPASNAQAVNVRDFEVETCIPHCADNLCQDDGCGGVCATCADNGYCDADDNCFAATCIDDAGDCNIMSDGGFESLKDADGPLTITGSSVHVGPTVIGEWTAFHRRYGFYNQSNYSCATVSIGGALVSGAGGGSGELVASLSSPGTGPSASGCQPYLYRKIGVPEFDPLNDVVRLKFSSKVAASGDLQNLYAVLSLHSDVSALPHNDDPGWTPVTYPALGQQAIFSNDMPLTDGIIDWPSTAYSLETLNGKALSTLLAPYRGKEIVVNIMTSDGDTNGGLEIWVDDVQLVIDEN